VVAVVVKTASFGAFVYEAFTLHDQTTHLSLTTFIYKQFIHLENCTFTCQNFDSSSFTHPNQASDPIAFTARPHDVWASPHAALPVPLYALLDPVEYSYPTPIPPPCQVSKKPSSTSKYHPPTQPTLLQNSVPD